ARRGRRLGVGVERSFLGPHGALAGVPSARARSVARLLAVAAREGRPAGTALIATAEHLDDLRSVERETRRELSAVTRTLGNTASVFAPLVGGAAVALAGRLGGNATGLGGPPVAIPDVGLAVGTYVLLLAVLLTALATGLARGLDRTLVGYRVGIALCSSATLFLLAFVVTRAAA
ncbi:MAG: type II secretion system protein, partial [Haloarculaceae archaeon]